jgi:hypothetical protein
MSLNNLNLLNLPSEIQLNIYKYLGASDLARLSCVNTEISRIARDNFLWKRLFAPRFPDQMHRAAKKEARGEAQEYKNLFIRAIETERRIDKAKYSKKVLDSLPPPKHLSRGGARGLQFEF